MFSFEDPVKEIQDFYEDNFPFRIDYCIYWKESDIDNSNNSEWIVLDQNGWSKKYKLIIEKGCDVRNNSVLDWAEKINGPTLYELTVGY